MLFVTPITKGLLKLVSDNHKFAHSTSVSEMAYLLSVSRPAAVALCKSLAGCNFGEFITGRRGHESRIEWARGHPDAMAIYDAMNTPFADGKELERPRPKEPEPPEEPLTISEAKRRLACTLGVATENIEIVIRA